MFPYLNMQPNLYSYEFVQSINWPSCNILPSFPIMNNYFYFMESSHYPANTNISQFPYSTHSFNDKTLSFQLFNDDLNAK